MANINKNIIMQAGAAVANATNKAAGLSASTPEPGSIISVIQLVNGGRTIGPDALAHFTESVRNKLLSLLVTMEPIQDFNGYSHPWPAGGGKNKYNKDNAALLGYINATGVFTSASSQTNPEKCIVSDLLPSGTYTVSKPITSKFRVGLFSTATPTNGTEAISIWSSEVPYQDTSLTVTTSESGYLVVFMWNGDNVESGRAFNTIIASTQIESGSTATSYAPYSNICPITGRTGLYVYVGPTSAIGDATAYSMDWTTPAGTVYGGSADVVSGDIEAAPYYASYNGETLVGPWVSSMDVYDPEGTPTTGAQVVDLGGTMTEYHITGQEIITLVGDNYIWSDSGDVTITE